MILMNDFKAEPQALRDEMLEAVQRVLNSGWFILGTETAEFEKTWAERCGVAHGVGVANGLDAIDIALRALSIGPGDEVITTPMTAFATVLAILRAGATPVLADIDPLTGVIAIDSAQRCLSPQTKAVVLVHLYGQICQPLEWENFCHTHGIALIEDCAQSHLAAFNGRVAGSFGKAAAFSFYPTKNLGAIGDGGMLVTNDSDIAAMSRQLRNYGQSVRYHHPVMGMNSRLDEIQSALLSVRLKWLDQFTTVRQSIAKRYHAEIKHPLVQLLAPPLHTESHVYHLFVITTPEREKLQKHLENSGIQTHIHYPVPVHHQAPCVTMKRDPQGLSSAEKHANTCLSVPCHPQMSDNDTSTVIQAINNFKP